MKKTVTYACTAIGGSLLVIGIGVLTAGRASGQYPIINSKVRVINKDSEAVPVKLQGNSSIQGTVKLDTTGNTVKAVQEGNWNVSLTGTPTVQLSTSNPIPVNDVSNQAGQPVQFVLDDASQSSIYSVPAGKRLVIEHVSGRIFGNEVNVVVELRTTVGGVLGRHVLPLTSVNQTVAAFGQEFRGYADSGTDVFFAAGGLVPPSVRGTISGRLVDVLN